MDQLCQLYRGLAHSGYSDTARELRGKVDKACRRWMTLSHRVSSVLTGQVSAPTVVKELESLTVWFSEVYMQLSSDHTNSDLELALNVSIMMLQRINLSLILLNTRHAIVNITASLSNNCKNATRLNCLFF